MNEAYKRRKEVNYETNVARCETCVAFVEKRLVMMNSEYKTCNPHCKKNNLTVRNNSICDLWQDKHGKVLDGA